VCVYSPHPSIAPQHSSQFKSRGGGGVWEEREQRDREREDRERKGEEIGENRRGVE